MTQEDIWWEDPKWSKKWFWNSFWSAAISYTVFIGVLFQLISIFVLHFKKGIIPLVPAAIIGVGLGWAIARNSVQLRIKEAEEDAYNMDPSFPNAAKVQTTSKIEEEKRDNQEMRRIEESFRSKAFAKRLVAHLQMIGQIPERPTDQEMDEYWDKWDSPSS